MIREDWKYAVLALALMLACTLSFWVPYAVADEGGGVEAVEQVQPRDYSEQLEAIRKQVEEIQLPQFPDMPEAFDYGERFQEIEELVSGIATIGVYQLVMSMVLVGVMCASVFVSAMRRF